MEVPPSEKTLPPFGRYLIRERIGQGGMGEVFVAVAVGADGFEKPVVIKRLLPKFASRPDIARLLAAEAKLMTRLVHPNIVQVIDFGRGENGDYFVVMELVGGADFGRFCEARAAVGKPVTVPLALYIASQVLRGLAHAHGTASADGKRLVHRDISPGNILVSSFGEVKVADFGVALVASTAESDGRDEWLVGKPAYMAPEQLERGPVDERADLFSVGAVLFQVLTGVSHAEPDARAALERAVSPELAAIVLRALAPRPEDRYESAREMGRAIEQLADQGQKIASADDLAAAVGEALQEHPAASRKVVVLSGGGLSAGTELTHFGANGEAGFSVKLQNPPRTPTPEPKREGAPASRRHRAPLVLAFLAILLGLGLLFSRKGGKTDEPSGPAHSVAPTPSAALAAPPAAVPSETPAPVDQAPIPSGEAALRAAHPARSHEPPREFAPGCRGQVHLYATHGWVVSGGPTPVQAPGRYDWPCGTYTLKAVSRVDPVQTRVLSISVREGSPGIVDLR
jgi:serine/threonine-protein kinase